MAASASAARVVALRSACVRRDVVAGMRLSVARRASECAPDRRCGADEVGALHLDVDGGAIG